MVKLQKKQNPKIQQLKRIHNQKDAGLKKKKQKAISNISVLSFKQSFSPAPLGRHQCDTLVHR